MIFNNKYEKIKLIGRSCFEIYKVLDKETNNFYALKLITFVKDDEKEKFKKEYEKEIVVMKNIKNKYIIELKDYFYDEQNEGYCIVMELCDCSLRDILEKYKPNGLPLKIIKKIFIQLNEALKTMIHKGFIHRDLKPENILIKYIENNENNFDIKLTDFGFSTDDIKSSIIYHSYAGTENYMAPEIVDYHYNNKCDLWSLGVILYELYTNQYIFYSNNKKEGIINRFEGKINETGNEMIDNLIRKLIQVDINNRIEWEEYFKDDFFKINDKMINIKINVKKNKKKIKIFNGNEYINENNIKLFIENKEIEFKKIINNLDKGIYNLAIEINQKVTNFKEMFKDCKDILEIDFLYFNTQDVTDMNGMFSGCLSLTNLDITNFNTKNVTNMKEMFSYCESLNNLFVMNFNTENVTDLSEMFYKCSSLKNLNIKNFVTKNVNKMNGMFKCCMLLQSLDITNFETSNVCNMSYMFAHCSSLKSLNISNNFNTKSVTNMEYMFNNCSSLINLDVSNFNTENVVNMEGMFNNCSSLIKLEVNNFDTKKVTDMSNMFSNCSSLSNLEVNNFDTKKVTDMREMFYNCSSLSKLKVNNFDTRNVIYIERIFGGCKLNYD